MKVLAIICFLCSIWFVSCKEDPRFRFNSFEDAELQSRSIEKYRLPDNIIPQEYRLTIAPYIEDVPAKIEPFTYTGTVEILVHVKKATNKIRMHANHLKITMIHVATAIDEDFYSIVNYFESPKNHFMDIHLAKELNANELYTINIEFQGQINDDKEGFYRSSYLENGKKKWLFATHFVPLGARRAFPCFDEPAMKAVFRLKLLVPPKWTALSNMEVESEGSAKVQDIGWYFKNHREVSFYPTYRMSTYGFAFTLTQFANFTSPTDKRFKVWAQPEIIKSCEYAASLAPKALKYLEFATGVDYMLPKMDQIAIPDIEPVETKNWGLLTYHEEALVYDEKSSTAEHLLYVTELIIHKVVHQWFGNLVSPKWWGNLWLNEGFATYLTAYVGSHIRPELRTDMHFLIDQYYRVFQTEELQMIGHIVDKWDFDHDDVFNNFDMVTYDKGGSIIRMIHNFMGEDNFWKGISAYLNEKKFKSADQNDLWRALSTHIPKGLLPENVGLKDVMHSWVLDSGYPIVNVTRNYDNNSVILTQTPAHHYISKLKYWVPLTILVQDAPEENAKKIIWLHKEPITIDSIPSDKWILVNNEKTGYYCVNYDKENWRKLFNSINGEDQVQSLSVSNRVQLLMDALTLPLNVVNKHLDYEIALESTVYLNHETEYEPWAVALDQFEMIQHRIASNDTAKLLFQTYLMGKMEHLYQHLRGFNMSLELDSLPQRLLRIRALQWLCSNGHEACNKDGLALFNEWRMNKKELHPDLRRIVFAAGIRAGNQETFEHLLKQYSVESDPVVITDMLYGLGATNITNHRWRLLYESIVPNSTTIRKEHALAVIKVLASNRDGTDIALGFMLQNYERAGDIWGQDGDEFRVIAPYLYSEVQLQRLNEFYETKLDAMNVNQLRGWHIAHSTVKDTILWKEEQLGSITSFLSPKKQPEVINDFVNSGSLAQVSHFTVLIALVVYKLL